MLSLITSLCVLGLCTGRFDISQKVRHVYPTRENVYEAFEVTSGVYNRTAREIISQYLVFCPGQDMCHDEYLKRPHVFNFTPSCTPCDCDDSCVRKSSCCPSKFLRHDADDLTRPSLSCVQPLWNPHPGFNVKSYWLIDNCPNGESCHLPQLQANNISLSTPVTSLLTNESYKNIHCALCHNESTLDLIFWKQNQVLCRKRSDLLLRKTPEELQQFVFREDPRCNVLFYPPRSLEDTIKPCVYVHDVPENLSSLVDADRPYLIQACNKYYVPYTNCHHTFKNVFCALCYQESLFGAIKQMPIECKEDNTDRLDYFKTFSALLDFDKEREVPTLENEICAWDQMYDNRMGKCLDLTCEKEYVLDQNPVDCRPKFFEWGENIYELSMIFKFSRQVDKEAVDNLTPYLMNILKKKVTQNNFSEYLCVIRIFELDDNNEWYFGALIGFAINKKHDIDNMIEKLIRIFEKDDANLHGYDVNISSSILGQRFHLSQNNGHFEFSPCRKYLNPMTLAEIIPSSSLELQSSFLCTEVSSTIVVADWYRCPKVKISTEDTKIVLVNHSLCLLDFNHCIPSRFFKKDYNNQHFEVCLDWYNRATNRMITQQKISDNELNIYLSVVCLSLSSCGSLLTIISYLTQKDPINSAGANIVILSLFLIIANTIYTFSNFFLQTKLLCMAAGIVIHFSWLFVVFWMSLSSFQVFQTFTKITVPSLKGKSNVLCFLLINSLLCLLLIGVNVTLSYTLSDGQNIGYSSRTCYIAESNMILYTFALPVGVSVCINTFMFVVTVNRIHRKGDMRKSRDQNRIGAYFRLSTLTGISWVFGFLAQFTDLQLFSVLHIIFSAGQGIFLFWGFGMPLGMSCKYARKS